MALRFNRRIRVAPGLTLNVSKSGASARVGVKGAGVTVGKRGVTTSAGLPGSGLSFSKTTSWKKIERLSARDQLHEITILFNRSLTAVEKIEAKLEQTKDRVHKAREILDGGRGPTESKRSTFERKLTSEHSKLELIQAELQEQLSVQSTAVAHLRVLRFGWFSGALRDQRDRACTQISELSTATETVLSDAIGQLDGIASSLSTE